ncbi:hypothetical protein J6590_046676 [Homalodisca vitripennis]|nr:hypothetical protein J6590_046676 [Homalodisca vitripennis]
MDELSASPQPVMFVYNIIKGCQLSYTCPPPRLEAAVEPDPPRPQILSSTLSIISDFPLDPDSTNDTHLPTLTAIAFGRLEEIRYGHDTLMLASCGDVLDNLIPWTNYSKKRFIIEASVRMEIESRCYQSIR